MNNPNEAFDAITSDIFIGWHVNDQPHVDADNFNDLDEMLAELGRRIEKSGRLEEARQNRRFTKPSEERRKERKTEMVDQLISEHRADRKDVDPSELLDS